MVLSLGTKLVPLLHIGLLDCGPCYYNSLKEVGVNKSVTVVSVWPVCPHAKHTPPHPRQKFCPKRSSLAIRYGD